MCVIMFVPKTRPTEEMIEKAFEYNDDGAGIAWRDVDAGGHKVVKWKKGLEDVEEVKRLCAELPMPYVVHFRIASIGGVNPKLTHPFPIDKKVSLALEGTTKGYVLFHNGHWSKWAERCEELAIRSATPIPTGRWSDTRGIAFIMSILGPGFMEFLDDQKGVVFGPNDAELFLGSKWDHINEVWCSNSHFINKVRHNPGNGVYNQGYTNINGLKECKFPTCQVKFQLDADSYCWRHTGGVEKNLPAVGGAGANLPFTQTTPRDWIMALPVAESLYKAKDSNGVRKLSKNKIKRMRSLWDDMSNPKKKEKARLALIELTQTICGTGPVH